MRALGLSADVSNGGIKQEPSHCRVRTAREHANFRDGQRSKALTFRCTASDNVPLNPLVAAV